MEKLYIYGKLNKEEIIKQYTAGLGDGTANTIIDNQNNKISVQVIKTPHKLSIKDVEFDGSQDIIVDLSEYATNEELSQLSNRVDTFDSKINAINNIANTELFAYVDTDSTIADRIVLRFKNKNNATLATSIIKFPDQIQADWTQADSTKPSYIKNKPLIPTKTSQLQNDSSFVTSEEVNEKDEKIVEKLNKDVLTELSFRYDLDDRDNVYLDKSLTNIASNDKTDLSEQVQLASDSQAGLMSMADYRQIRKNTERIEALEGKTTRLLYTAKTDPTADEITTFVTGLGYTAPFESIAVVIDKTFHIWHYYENDNIGWRDDGVDTVTQFTNESLGTIKGAEVDGKVYAETDGTGSVYGWGALKGQVTNIAENLDSYVLKTTKVAGKPLSADINLSTLIIKQSGVDIGTYDGSEDFELNIPDGSSSDYKIVTAEPEDKSQGKMIYEKSSGVTLGKAVVDKTPAGKYYSSPAGLVDKIFGGTAVPSDIETYEYLLFKENEYVAGYINIGDLPELTQYALTHNSIEVIFKVNNGAEQSDILTKNSDGSFGNTSNKFQTMKSQTLVEGAGSDYYTLDLQAGGVAQSFKIAETDTIQITKLKLGDVYINIDKGSGEGPFAIENLKIADGIKYNSLKDLVNEGMQEKLTAGTGITIENNIISATAQDIRTDNQTITLNANQEIQTVGVYATSTNNTLYGNDLWLASSIKRRKK